MAPTDFDMIRRSASLNVLLAKAMEEAKAVEDEAEATHKALTRTAAIRQFKLAALCVAAVHPPIEALASAAEHLRGEGSARAAALAYQVLRQPSLQDHPAVKQARIETCEAVVLYVASVAGHRDKEAFDRELAVALGEAPDDVSASQFHKAYHHIMNDVPGAFVSGNTSKGRKKSAKQRVKREESCKTEPFDDFVMTAMLSEPQSEPDVNCGAKITAFEDDAATWHDRLLWKIQGLPAIVQNIGEDGNQLLNDTLAEIYAGIWYLLNHGEEGRTSARAALQQFAQQQQTWPFPLGTEIWVGQEYRKCELQHRFETVVLLFGVDEILSPLVHQDDERKLEAAHCALMFLNDLTPFSHQSALNVLQFVLGQGQFERVSVGELSMQCRASALGLLGSLLPGAFTPAGNWSSELLDAALEEALAVSELCVDRAVCDSGMPHVLHVAFWSLAQMIEGAERLCGQEERIGRVATRWLELSQTLWPDAPGVTNAQEQACRLISVLGLA